jgi:hypothetical protein
MTSTLYLLYVLDMGSYYFPILVSFITTDLKWFAIKFVKTSAGPNR